MRLLLLPVFLFIMFMGQPAQAQLGQITDFAITVLAKDAKFVGTGMGGARIIITDRRTGDIIIEGVTSGTTGETANIMSEDRARDAVLTSQNSAKFEFSLDMAEPIPVTITAAGPLAQPQAQAEVSMDTILLPGKDYTQGNGIMLILPGFAVDVMAPPAHTQKAFNPDEPVVVTANIVKMCGCHIAEGSPWPPERYEVEAHIYMGERFITRAPMSYSGTAGQFAARLGLPQAGTYRIIVSAYDPQTKEAGMDETTIVLQEPAN